MVAVLFKAGDQVPVMPLFDVVGSAGKVVPEQMGATGLNVGVMFGITVTVYVVGVAHWPVPGVNVYVLLVVLLTTAGVQVPVIPLDEVAGKLTTAAPSQMVVLVPKAKVGATIGFTVTVNVVPATHPADVAVNTYVSDRVASTTAGDQVPVMLLVSVLGNTGTVPLLQMVRDVPNGKPAVLIGITVVVRVTGVPQVPAAGVNV